MKPTKHRATGNKNSQLINNFTLPCQCIIDPNLLISHLREFHEVHLVKICYLKLKYQMIKTKHFFENSSKDVTKGMVWFLPLLSNCPVWYNTSRFSGKWLALSFLSKNLVNITTLIPKSNIFHRSFGHSGCGLTNKFDVIINVCDVTAIYRRVHMSEHRNALIIGKTRERGKFGMQNSNTALK